LNILSLTIKGFRNFKSSLIHFNNNTLIIGANDVGKSNMLHALRLLLDKGLSELEIEPSELDFHLSSDKPCDIIEITIHFNNITEDSVLSVLKGYVNDEGDTYLRYSATKSDLNYEIYIGHSLDELEIVNSRFYLKYVNLRYIHSQRDLHKFIRKEKRQLLNLAQQNLTAEETEEDADLMNEISTDLVNINEKVSQLIYVEKSTSDVNCELKKLAHHYSDYSVQLDSGAIQVNQFIEKLQLGANTNGSSVMLGGDGRNNQILLALWKAKSVREQYLSDEVVFYVVEEPEAHLHPHQQRKLAEYLNSELPGQSIISSHSPQIASKFSPDSIIRLFNHSGATEAAGNGCSDCIALDWESMGYRMSILPSEAFFSSGVFLVEGPSEMLFYTELADSLGIELDFLNISLLSVDGISFGVYTKILDALEIPWVMRTDNDISKISKKDQWQYAGFNRCLKIASLETLNHKDVEFCPELTIGNGEWEMVSSLINPSGIFVSRKDLENDLSEELPEVLKEFAGKKTNKAAIDYLQKKKAIRMRNFLKGNKESLATLSKGELAKPLHHLKKVIVGY
jgi:putative ATP-dependent endonuclease of OLD family